MKIAHLIFFGFVFILLLFTITTYMNSRQSEKVNENASFLSKSFTVVRQGNRFQRNLINMSSGLRGYLLTGEKYFLQTYDSAVIENRDIIRELRTLTADDTLHTASLNKIENLNNAWIQEFVLPITTGSNTAETSDSRLLALDRFYQQKLLSAEERNISSLLQESLREFINHEYDNREERKNVLAASVFRTKRITFLLTTFSVIAGLVISGFLAYIISSRIMKMVNMANTIAAGNYKVHIKDSGRDELSKLAKALNHMSFVLTDSFAQLKRKNKELDQFAHIVSHDLKSPLRGIDNVVSWIEEDHGHELSPKVQEYFQLIKGRLVRSENLIQGILSYARIGKEEQPRELIDIKELVQEVMEGIPEKPGLKLIVHPQLPTFRTERLPLMQIFSNLMSNAVKYHDKPNGNLKIYHHDHTTHYEFFVEDDGPGIADNYHNKIFQIFQTLQEKDSFESTGVGLAIVKKILDDRNETINLKSQPGKGTIFSFTWTKA